MMDPDSIYKSRMAFRDIPHKSKDTSLDNLFGINKGLNLPDSVCSEIPGRSLKIPDPDLNTEKPLP